MQNEEFENFVKQEVKFLSTKPTSSIDDNGTNITPTSTFKSSPSQSTSSALNNCNYNFFSREFLNCSNESEIYEDYADDENLICQTSDSDTISRNFDIFNELSLKIRNHYNNYILSGEEDPWVNS